MFNYLLEKIDEIRILELIMVDFYEMGSIKEIVEFFFFILWIFR